MFFFEVFLVFLYIYLFIISSSVFKCLLHCSVQVDVHYFISLPDQFWFFDS